MTHCVNGLFSPALLDSTLEMQLVNARDVGDILVLLISVAWQPILLGGKNSELFCGQEKGHQACVKLAQ